MNCKPGDIAVVIKSCHPADDVYLGMVVTCKRLINANYPYWEVENELPRNGEGMNVNGILDRFLRPIRPDESPEESTEAMRLLTQLPQKEKV